MDPIIVYTPKSWETVSCCFCNSTNAEPYERFGINLQYTYQKCKDCSLIYQSPRPKYDQDFIDAAYKHYFQFNEDLELNENTEVAQSSVQLFREEMENIIQFDKLRTAVLDIGSGMGTFLYTAKSYYENLTGLDVSPIMAAFVEKKLNVKIHLEQFDQFNYPGKFSLIHMSHVIEHVPNPNEWIAKASTLLEKDGVLVINVPNKYAYSFRLQHFFVKLGLKRQFSSSWMDARRTPDHLFEPTVKSMLLLLRKHNYKILDHFSYSRRDPASNKSFFSRIYNRVLFAGSNLSFIVTPQNN